MVDLNTLSSVFNTGSKKHPDFKPVYDWIIFGRGSAVFGGTKYKTELAKSYAYVKLFRRLKEAHRAVEIRQGMVDSREAELTALIADKECDDQHIIAILCVSGCLLLCSEDKRSFPFVLDRQYYEKGRRPRIYQRAQHKSLLRDENIVKLRNTG